MKKIILLASALLTLFATGTYASDEFLSLTQPQLQTIEGERKPIWVRKVAADGNCAFTSLGFTRQEYIADVVQLYKMSSKDSYFRELVNLAITEFDINIEDEDAIDQWAAKYNDSSVWMDNANMHIAAFMYEMEIRINKRASDENGNTLYIPLGETPEMSIINESHASGVQPTSVRHLVWVMGVHYDELVFEAPQEQFSFVPSFLREDVHEGFAPRHLELREYEPDLFGPVAVCCALVFALLANQAVWEQFSLYLFAGNTSFK